MLARVRDFPSFPLLSVENGRYRTQISWIMGWCSHLRVITDGSRTGCGWGSGFNSLLCHSLPKWLWAVRLTLLGFRFLTYTMKILGLPPKDCCEASRHIKPASSSTLHLHGPHAFLGTPPGLVSGGLWRQRINGALSLYRQHFLIMRKSLLTYLFYNECNIMVIIRKTSKAIYISEKIIKNLITCGPT